MNVDFQLEANKLIKIQENMQKVTACTPIANVTESLPKGETSSVDLGEKKIKKQTSSLLPVQLQKELAKNSIGKIYDYFNQKKILPFSLEHLKNLSLEQITELFFGLFLLDSVEGYLKNHEDSYQNIAKDLTSLYEYIYNGKNLSNEMLICKHKIDLKQAFYGLKTLHNQIDIKKLTLHEMGFGGDCPEEVLFRLCHFMIETKINLVKVYINFTSKIIKNENLNSLSLGKHLYKLIESFRKQINEVENLFQLLQENDSEQYLYVDVVFSTTLLGNVVKIHPILKHLDDFSVSLEELKTNSAEPHVILSQFEEMQYQLKMIKTKIVLQDLLTITINKANFRPAKLPETSKSYKKPNLNWLDYIDKTSLKKKSCRKNENSFPCNPKSLLPLQRHQDEKVSEEFEVNVTEISPPIVVKADISLNSKQQILRKEEYFHLHHLQRTVELINKLDSNSNYAKTLLSMVVNASYHFIEIGQTLNHGYLSHQHGLERFETHPALRENQMGTIWYRYPHSSTSFYPNHDLLPKALSLLTTKSSIEHRTFALHLIQTTLNYRLASKNFLFDQEIHSIGQNLLEMAEKACLNETIPPKNAAHSLNPKIDSLLDYVEQASVRVERDLKNLLLDFKEHLMRFKEGLELLTLFPEQKYWSLHARNLAYSTQYLAEHLGLIQAQIENVYLRTHHLEDYCQEFEWQKHIGKQATSQIVQHNYLKYLDYPYQTSPIDERLTKSLNDLYQYSCLEEGYMPHYAKQLEPKKIVSSLFKIQEETFQALEKLSKHVFQQLESPIS